MRPILPLTALTATLLLSSCGGGQPAASLPGFSELPVATQVQMVRVKGTLGAPDPKSPLWKDASPVLVKLLAQPMITPRPESTTTEALSVEAIHDGTTAAFRIRWPDSEKSEAGILGEYSDAVAIQLPFNNRELPPVIMGNAGQPVHIFHWRAQYQRDVEKGKPTMEELYPNASVDMYAMDFHDAPGGSRDEREMFNPGVALGNPQSFHKTAVDEIIAEGFSTSAVQAGHGSDGKGVWENGFWTVVIQRPLMMEGGAPLPIADSTSMAFAVWQGGKGEVGSRKSILLAWLPLKVDP
jgi:hypothetical protein